MWTPDRKPLKPETITSALLCLRAQLVRDGGSGLEHVEALLQLRGDNLAPVPRKTARRFRKGKLRAIVLAALRDGPQTLGDVADAIRAECPDMSRREAAQRAQGRLAYLRRAGVVVREGRLWCNS